MSRPAAPISARCTAEFVGTAFLLAAVVGSGIMAERLTTDEGLRLFQNAFATGAVLVALILSLGPVSGAHLNPAVTLADRILGGVTSAEAVAYVASQIAGGVTGVMVANIMFDLPAIEIASNARSGSHLWVAEAVATLGLLVAIFGVVRSGRGQFVAFSVGAYIAGAYYFTSSTSFANPAVTVARSLSDTFAGIEPAHIAPFVAAQSVGVLIAVGIIALLYPGRSDRGTGLVDPEAGLARPRADI